MPMTTESLEMSCVHGPRLGGASFKVTTSDPVSGYWEVHSDRESVETESG